MAQVTTIEFKYAVGERVWDATLSQDLANGGGWSLTINRYHQGTLLYQADRWRFYYTGKKPCFITSAEIDIMLEMILYKIL